MKPSEKKWKILGRKLIHGHPFPLYEETIKLPTGEITTYTVNRSKNAAAVLLTPKKGYVLLTYQYRFPVDSWIYDLPGGKINDNESPESAAVRECIEETGYKPARLRKLAYYYMRPSRSDGTLHIFFADKGVKVGGKKISATEKVQTKVINTKKFERLLKNNTIVDPTLLIAWHTARYYGYI